MEKYTEMILKATEVKVIKLDKVRRTVQYKIIKGGWGEFKGLVYTKPLSSEEKEDRAVLMAAIRNHYKDILIEAIEGKKSYEGMTFRL